VDELMEEKEALLQKFEEEKVSRHDTSLWQYWSDFVNFT
jgi:hypothetical protein